MENPLNFAIRNWMIKQKIDSDENWYGKSFKHHFQKITIE